ncbi:MAG: hypothetical protein IKE20_04340 [Eggerthellaceae bacterium]|nr:hypothetical protein [Eggerthellaceae bacterium]
MDATIITALISGIFVAIGSIGAQVVIADSNKRKTDAERAVRDALLDQRLESIDKKLDEHNGYAKRFEEVAVSLAEMRTEIKNMKG